MLTVLKRITRFTAKILSVLLLFLFVGLFAVTSLKAAETVRVQQIGNQLIETRRLNSNEGDWSNGMLDLNKDYVGWLTVYGTQVNGPVVQGETNDAYLRTDFYGQHSTAGTLFMDSVVDTGVDGNVIIYGHRMKDGTMFGSLKQYKDKEFFKQNSIIRWEDVHGEHYYRIFAGMITSGAASNPRFVNLEQWANCLDDETSKDMLKTIQEKAFVFSPYQFRDPENQYIFLVTCDYTHNNDRLVLVGERF